MKTRISPTKFLAVLDELHRGAPILCAQSRSGGARVWTSDRPPLGVEFAYWYFFDGGLPTTEALAEAIDHLVDRSRAGRQRQRAKEAVAAKRVPGGYIDRRTATGGAQ